MLRQNFALLTCGLTLTACAATDPAPMPPGEEDGLTDSVDSTAGPSATDAISDAIAPDGPDFTPDPSLAGVESSCPGGMSPRVAIGSSLHRGDLHDLSDLSSDARAITGDVLLHVREELPDVEALRCIHTIGGTLRVEGHPQLARLALPNLRQVGAVELESLPALERVVLPKLREVEAIEIRDSPALEVLQIPLLEDLPGGLLLEDVAISSLAETLPSLSSAGSVDLIELPALVELDHASIDLDGGRVLLSGLDSLESLDDFPFESVGELDLEGNPILASTAGATVLNGATVRIWDHPYLEDLEVLRSASWLSSVDLADNTAITEFTDFDDLVVVRGDLLISNHSALHDVGGLSNLRVVEGDLRITGAAALNADGLAELEEILSKVVVAGELVVSGAE